MHMQSRPLLTSGCEDVDQLVTHAFGHREATSQENRKLSAARINEVDERLWKRYKITNCKE